jgi:hypothetical protein
MSSGTMAATIPKLYGDYWLVCEVPQTFSGAQGRVRFTLRK